MITNMDEKLKFYCPRCKVMFSCAGDDGVAKCPICKVKRSDGFNQIGHNCFQCVACKCRFENISKEGLKCPNGCVKEDVE